MARPSRQEVLGNGPAVVHVNARCHNGEFLLADEIVKTTLYLLLFFYKTVYKVLIYEYCFMDSHIHIIIEVAKAEDLSRFMQQVFSQLARFINKRMQRTGEVFQDRAKTPLIQSGDQFLITMRYIDRNPVRANMVRKAHDYPWSSYRHYAYGEQNDLIDDAPEYLGLSKLPAKRRLMYQRLVLRLPHEGKRKLKIFSTRYFIGDAAWILAMMRKAGFTRPRIPPDIFNR